MSDLVQISQHRIRFLMRLFGVSSQELLDELNKRRKRKLVPSDVFAEEIKSSTLDAIDNYFEIGTLFYYGDDDLTVDSKSSFMFRKRNRSKSLSVGDKKIVAKSELKAAGLSYYAENSSWKIPEGLAKRKVSDDPVAVALSIRQELQPKLQSNDKKYLIHLIDLISEKGILVLEFVDKALKKENMSEIAGFFFKPNNIVLKRNNLTYKSEIFTLLHELGHYLLNKEEIDVGSVLAQENGSEQSDEEKWCNDFAFAFLTGNMDEIDLLDPNDSKTIRRISDQNHVSPLAVYTHLLKNGKLSNSKYFSLQTAIIKSSIEAFNAKTQRGMPTGTKSTKKIMRSYQRPIISKLEKHICATAYHDGLLDERELLLRFRYHKLESILDAW